ncbi:hypothetical protein AB0D37_08385 [Streptomyces sp. NPDC048384]|uniref:hypothetical protein n=1 Tax=Streptomyces sp. NPDC048384 TaxID=3155487 RepID=UPI00343B7D7E
MRKILLIRLVGYGIDASNHWALADPEYVRATAFGTASGNVFAATQTGHIAQAPLAEAAARKELATAKYISDAPIWRLRRMANLPAYAPAPEPAQTSRLTDRQAMAPHLSAHSASRAPCH